jgi:hypothetical protein
MSRGLRYPSIAAMPDGMRQAAERATRRPLPAEHAPKAPRRGEHPSEHVEATRLFEQVLLRQNEHPELRWFHAIPNGGDRHKATAGKMKAEGQRAGVADYSLPVPRGEFHGLYIELKSMTGYASDEQKEFVQFVRGQGFRAEVCRGWRAAWAVVCDYLGIEARA